MPDEPTRRVTITAPGWSIDVHADGEPLAQVADTARALFEDLHDPAERLGPASAGFQLPGGPAGFTPEWGRGSSVTRRPVRGGAE